MPPRMTRCTAVGAVHLPAQLLCPAAHSFPAACPVSGTQLKTDVVHLGPASFGSQIEPSQ